MAPATVALPEPWLCRWAAALFLAPPGVKALAVYRGQDGQALLEAIAARPELARTAALLSEATATNADLAQSAARFAAAHARAFLTATRRSVPPYASFWLSERGLLFQEPARAMNRLLATLGLRPGDTVKEPADHLSIQLDLLARLIEHERDGQATPISAQAFARDHIMTWLPAFSAACEGLAEPYFYADLAGGLARMLADHLENAAVPAPSLASASMRDGTDAARPLRSTMGTS